MAIAEYCIIHLQNHNRFSAETSERLWSIYTKTSFTFFSCGTNSAKATYRRVGCLRLPRMEPSSWDAPTDGHQMDDVDVPTCTCHLSHTVPKSSYSCPDVSKDLIQWCADPVIPNDLESRSRRISWSTVSKAALTSIHNTTLLALYCIALLIGNMWFQKKFQNNSCSWGLKRTYLATYYYTISGSSDHINLLLDPLLDWLSIPHHDSCYYCSLLYGFVMQ